MTEFFRRYWRRLNLERADTNQYWEIAVQNAGFYSDMKPLIAKYARGRLLDLGAGRLTWRTMLKQYASSYTSSDLSMEHRDIDVLCDVTRPLPFADGCFDSVFCCSVLEHVTDPGSAFAEIARVLKQDGFAIISVPFLFYLHGQPHDYYRYTRYGLLHLSHTAGLELVELIKQGGLFQLLFNIPSVLISTLAFALRLEFLIWISTRALTQLARALDNGLDMDGLFATNHIVVLRKNRLTPITRH